ncbi:alpha/beta fold hydrolase [Nocardiopsis alba]|uniref:Alpha/beta hydrolase fold family protein n=1 Tax=Nocardiopsis alba (strain ATCC BAA-2165 / BE74) TaxID=1205910 RepID=J7KZ14_NOCAA|nr:alpha/beta hydrolase [Nocardiopsis alba]AFR06618.1 alpha/beta hydrolase fold family protein [Nocardiopsis alba ATCC BAA-2165]
MDRRTWSPVRWARNGEVRLAFDTWGEENGGDPILLIMGMGINRQWWPDDLCRALAEQGFSVARYDNRDSGESTYLPPVRTRKPFTALMRRRGDAYTAEDMADDAIAVMDELGWGSAHVFGISLGGAIAQRVAIGHPDRVRTLTSMAAVPADVSGPGLLRYINLFSMARLVRWSHPATREGAIQGSFDIARFCASSRRPFDEEEARERAERLVDHGSRDNLAHSRQIGAQWHGPGIDAITVPTLVIHGQDDPLIRPRAAADIAARVPGARPVVLPGVGHDVPGFARRPVAELIRGLADEVPASSGSR